GRFSNDLSTLFTQSQGFTYCKGDYVLFHVQIKCNGLFAIFGIPQKLLINNILPLEDILGDDNRLLTEQFQYSKDVYEMGTYMNAYLMRKLSSQKHKVYTTNIASVSNCIL